MKLDTNETLILALKLLLTHQKELIKSIGVSSSFVASLIEDVIDSICHLTNNRQELK